MTLPVTRLLLDAGNTRIKWALVRADDWLATGVVETANPGSLAEGWAHLPAAPQRLVACNVAGERVGDAVAAIASGMGLVPHWLASSPHAAGVTSAYDRPAQLGADRWAAALGAWRRLHRACVIVNAGTALTVDAIDDAGCFLGGLIVPGIHTMLDALATRTAGLARQTGTYRAFPSNTGDAMWTGAIDAAIGAVERVLRRLSEHSGRAVEVLVSGGGAELLLSHLAASACPAEHLVLEGLLAFDIDVHG